jgi:hypothetical protein
MFEFYEPYKESDPQQIRSDFNDILSFDIARRLACYLPTDTLRAFLDDVAMGRV